MLVLGRKIGEEIFINLPDGRQVVVRVLEVSLQRDSGNLRVRLGVTAPRDVPVWRSELLTREGQPASPPGQPDRAAVRGEGGAK